MGCLKSDYTHTYLQKTPLHGPAMRERSLSCGHKNIVARPYTSKDTQPLDHTYPLRVQTRSKNYNPVPWEEKTVNIERLKKKCEDNKVCCRQRNKVKTHKTYLKRKYKVSKKKI